MAGGKAHQAPVGIRGKKGRIQSFIVGQWRLAKAARFNPSADIRIVMMQQKKPDLKFEVRL
jgi:hypothetical protein